jgi:hypothetical protein
MGTSNGGGEHSRHLLSFPTDIMEKLYVEKKMDVCQILIPKMGNIFFLNYSSIMNTLEQKVLNGLNISL